MERRNEPFQMLNRDEKILVALVAAVTLTDLWLLWHLLGRPWPRRRMNEP